MTLYMASSNPTWSNKNEVFQSLGGDPMCSRPVYLLHLAAALLLLGSASPARSATLWTWSFATEEGTFITDGDGTGTPGTYTLLAFAVTESVSSVFIGSSLDGVYHDPRDNLGGYGHTFDWDGTGFMFSSSDACSLPGALPDVCEIVRFKDLIGGATADYRFKTFIPGDTRGWLIGGLGGGPDLSIAESPLTVALVGETTIPEIPEPSTASLLALGLAGLAAKRRRPHG
jgi:hypothetical protein